MVAAGTGWLCVCQISTNVEVIHSAWAAGWEDSIIGRLTPVSRQKRSENGLRSDERDSTTTLSPPAAIDLRSREVTQINAFNTTTARMAMGHNR